MSHASDWAARAAGQVTASQALIAAIERDRPKTSVQVYVREERGVTGAWVSFAVNDAGQLVILDGAKVYTAVRSHNLDSGLASEGIADDLLSWLAATFGPSSPAQKATTL